MSRTGLFLLRKDPALKGMLASVPIMTLIGLAIRFSGGERLLELSDPGRSGFAVFLFVVVWCVMLFHTVGTGFWSRCSRIAMVLPIPARELWAWRLVAVTAAVVLPVTGMTLALGAGIDPSIFMLGGKVLAVLLLLLAIGQNPFPKLFRIQVSAVYVVFLVFASFLALIYLLLTPATVVTILIPAALALLISIQTFLAVPRGFLLVPDRPGYPDGSPWWKWLDPPDLAEDAGPVEPEAAPETAPQLTFRQVLHWTLFRTLVNRLNIWLIGLVMIFISWAILYEFLGGQGAWMPLCYTPLWLMAHFQQSPQWIGSLAHLPIRRRLIFRYVAGSMLLPMLVGVLLSFLVAVGEKPVLVNLDRKDGIDLEVPFEFWEIGEAGNIYEAVAPWGERLQLPAYTIIGGYRQVVVNPFGVGEDSSERFIAWQQARAIQAVYGLSQTPDLDNPQVPPGARSRTHHRTWGLILFLLSIGLVAGLRFSLLQFRRTWARFLVKGMIPILAIPIVLIILAILIGPATGLTSREGIDVVPVLFLSRLAGSLEISGGVYLLASLLVLIAGYFLVGRTFGKVEPDPTPIKSIAHDYRF